MEVFMTNIPLGTSNFKLKIELAKILHAPPFATPTALPMNFEIYLFPRRRRSPWQYAALTLPSARIGEVFLQLYGQPNPRHILTVGNSRIQFQRSRNAPRREVLEQVQRLPFEDPHIAQAREREAKELEALSTHIRTIQFGWECRDQVFSIEWEKSCTADLIFVDEQREFRVKVHSPLAQETRIIAIRASQIGWASAAVDPSSGVPTIFFSLSNPPSFETESSNAGLFDSLVGMLNLPPPKRQKWSAFDPSHEALAPYTSLALRLEAASLDDLRTFRKLTRMAHINIDDFAYRVERRGLFDASVREECALWAMRLPWIVSFQVEALLRANLVDFKEMRRLQRPIEEVLRRERKDYTAALLREFIGQAKSLFWYGEDPVNQERTHQPSELFSGDVVELFSMVSAKFVYRPLNTALNTADATAPFHCLRVTVTPTTMHLEGPFPERSNRVMREYYRSQDCFLRVSFQDENRLQLRFDREIDGRDFVNRRIKEILLKGIEFPGAHFDFLAYSQSALKEHAVWFVKPFAHTDDQGGRHFINAAEIIRSLGTFSNLTFDRTLIRCPARYAARISQAFTATDASITVDAGQIIFSSDIKDSLGRAFTDGVGTISTQLAKDIWRALQENKRRGRRDRTYPRAYQVRFQGSKGVLSVDHTLPGRSILLRPSMIKFEAPNSRNIEIARAFSKPSPYYLNRPLIMLLEGLGVPARVFQTLQENAVRDVQASVESLEQSARLLECHGLGASFRLTSVMLGLHKLGVGPLDDDEFWRQSMDFAVNHVLRELKHKARIPVPGGWTLVGVADVHGYLEEGEIFVCIDSPEGVCYLEGRTLISRSPTIHPGDVQVVQAIGRPPPGSPFERESLRNTVVFSTKGSRPLPSYLGGGDLDGDEYNITTMPELLPPRTFDPANYDPAQRRLVDHDSTMADVAEFVAEYIVSDTLGIIATTWLIIADQSESFILDPDCLKLAALHSDAVDYPKSGQPVPIEHIPRLHRKQKPDWNAPETASVKNGKYYESNRAIGKLYRAIDLPAPKTVGRTARTQQEHMGDVGDSTGALPAILARFRENWWPEEDEAFDAVYDRVAEFTAPEVYDDATVTSIWELYSTYVSRLRSICADHALQSSRTAMLTEEEAVVGTIVANCSQPRKRKDLMAQLREQTAILVGDVRHELEGEEDTPHNVVLRRSWIAFRMAGMTGKAFGGRSFSWLALGAIFDVIKEFEELERAGALGYVNFG
ncbi:RdRP-domain-containing protein [Lenzites betulinus]|nr:RdRP-domain-containing protein [Lenzites betulinus]